ncbi:hypothetical protein [Lutimonas sp.]|uniref:hypothetical protein n=1 Tax=Lutimonas sp. TaxID=1872403 RepID=UPI003D9AD5C9
MKKLIITHLLLNLYLLVLIQPALPVLEYLINYDYIVNELCENREKPILTCNGKCYLGDQVEKSLERGTEDQKPLPPQIEFKEFVSLQASANQQQASFELVAKQVILTPVTLENSLYARSLLRPPQL